MMILFKILTRSNTHHQNTIISGKHKVAIRLEDLVIDRLVKPIIVKRNHENDLSSSVKDHHKIKDSLGGEHEVAIRLEHRVIDSQNVLVRPKLGNMSDYTRSSS